MLCPWCLGVPSSQAHPWPWALGTGGRPVPFWSPQNKEDARPPPPNPPPPIGHRRAPREGAFWALMLPTALLAELAGPLTPPPPPSPLSPPLTPPCVFPSLGNWAHSPSPVGGPRRSLSLFPKVQPRVARGFSFEGDRQTASHPQGSHPLRGGLCSEHPPVLGGWKRLPSGPWHRGGRGAAGLGSGPPTAWIAGAPGAQRRGGRPLVGWGPGHPSPPCARWAWKIPPSAPTPTPSPEGFRGQRATAPPAGQSEPRAPANWF